MCEYEWVREREREGGERKRKKERKSVNVYLSECKDGNDNEMDCVRHN